MPAPQFHLTFGELVARHPDIRPAMRAAVEAEPVYTHLGSIFHDRITEKYHALFFHVERFGDDVLGKPEFRPKTRVVKQGSGSRAVAEPQIVAFMREAYRHAYGNAPRGEVWKRWVLNFRHFGL